MRLSRINNILRAIYGLMPYYMADKCLFMIYSLKSIGLKAILSRNKSIKDTKKGCAYLIATGPSLASEDLSNIFGKDCYTVSNAILHNNIKQLNPIAHFLAAYHEPISLKNFNDWLLKIDQLLPEMTVIVTDIKNKEIIEDLNVFNSREVYYLLTYRSSTLDSVDITGPIPAPWTVPQLALPYLLYSGYEEINLIGVDHNALKNYKDGIKHFFDIKKDQRDNASSSSVWNNGDIIKHLTNELLLFKLYKQYDSFAKGMGVRLTVSNSESWLDFLEHKSCVIDRHQN